MSETTEFDHKKVKTEPVDSSDNSRRSHDRRLSKSPKPSGRDSRKRKSQTRSLSPPRQYSNPNRVKREDSRRSSPQPESSHHSSESRNRRPGNDSESRQRRESHSNYGSDSSRRVRDHPSDSRRNDSARHSPDRHRDNHHRKDSPPRREHPEHSRRSPVADDRRRRHNYERSENYSRNQRFDNRQDDSGNRKRQSSPRNSNHYPLNPERRRLGLEVVKKEVPDNDEMEREENKKRKLQDLRGKRKGRKNEEVDSSKFAWGKEKEEEEEKEPEVPLEKPNFGLSGKLAEDTNTFNGVVVKYNEPSEARKPKLRWRLYPFKGDEALPVLYIHRQSAYLIGKDRKVADIPTDHPSCSRQHAAFQYRAVPVELGDGRKVSRIKPYIIDLGSANGTFLNNNRIEASRYYELHEKDVLKFGFSSREYVVLNEKSKDVEPEIHSDASGGSPEPTETETEGLLDGL